jgi:leucyl aminopeptidase
MHDMSMDMAGAATVAGVIKSAALGKLKSNIIGLVGLVENMPGPLAQRPGDIIESMKGDTIEVNNTDAEGRLVLADLLWFAQKNLKSEKIIDLATLTGAIIVSLGHEFAGAFSNDDRFCKNFIKNCALANEKVWRMPLDKVFRKSLKSQLADLSNVGGRNGSAIVAAMFLNNFVEKNTAWIHLDIAGVAKTPSESLYSRRGASGWGIISLFEFLTSSVETLET